MLLVRHRIFFTVIAFASVVGSGLSVAQPSPGLVFAETHCAMCHAIRSSDESPHRAAPPFRRLGTLLDLDRLEQDLRRGNVLPSHPDMPLFKMDAKTAKDIVSYIRSLQE